MQGGLEMENTPRGSRLHIAIFGNRNAGKSSLINAITRQNLALVSPVAGTTTDPVYKAMEILPIGPVMLIDTAGIDDVGDLGKLRIEKTMQVLNKTDLAILVLDPQTNITNNELELIDTIQERSIPILAVFNKSDIALPSSENISLIEDKLGNKSLNVSALTNENIETLKQFIIKNAPEKWEGPPVLGDLINKGETVILVTPIDESAPKGRMILPQNQAIRDVLDYNACAVVVKEFQLQEALDMLKKPPALVVTDSQVFEMVSSIVPSDIPLTSFSILYARNKGDLETLVKGAMAIDNLKDGDNILIAEGCTHHCQVADIGRVKIPNWLKTHTGKNFNFEWVSGGTYPLDLNKYQLIIHCGGCMLNRREVLHRISIANAAELPIVNYGVFIAKIHGILDRVLSPFPNIKKYLE